MNRDLETAQEMAKELGIEGYELMALEQLEAAIEAALEAGAGDGEKGNLGQKEGQSQAAKTLDDIEGDEEETVNWKEARSILKAADADCGHSIDEYAQRTEINSLKKRYNSKERTVELYSAIVALGEG